MLHSVSGIDSPTYSLRIWDQSTWQTIPGIGNATVYSILNFDPDARPPEEREWFANRGIQLVRLDGSPISEQTQRFDAVYNRAAMWWDIHGDGSEHALLLAVDCNGLNPRIVRWNGSAWVNMGSTFEWCVRGTATCDFDGDGPEPPQLFALGTFGNQNPDMSRYIARWNGNDWEPLSQQMPYQPTSFLIRNAYPWDPDGDGPMTPRLLVMGIFQNPASGLYADSIAAWNGESWEAFSPSLWGEIRSMTSWDPDGDGPQPPRTIICGNFRFAGSSTPVNIAEVVGHTIQPFPISGLHTQNATYYEIAAWDPDGPGPMAEQLVVAGKDIGISGADVCRWTGINWQPMGASANFITSDSTWGVFALHSIDPDGDGPLPDVLYAGGGMNPSVRIWNGVDWVGVPIATGTVYEILPVSPSPEAHSPGVIIAGEVIAYQNPQLPALTIMGPAVLNHTSPNIDIHPMDTPLCASGMAIFTGGPDYEGPERRWQIALPTAPEDWLDLHEGAYMVGDAVVLHTFGVRTGELFVTMPANGARALLGGNPRVRCVLSNSCGESITDAAELRLCPADLDCSDSIDDLDITEFFTLFEAGAAAADFTGDGSIDDLDIAVFFEAFESGC